jgi:hypothetical protein
VIRCLIIARIWLHPPPQNASCARANVFLLDEGAPAVLLLRAARSLRREQAAGLRVIDNDDRHLQLFRLTSCHVCGWKCARRRSPWNGQAHQITTVPLCGKCGLRYPGMTQARSTGAILASPGLAQSGRDSKRLLRPFLSHRRASRGQREGTAGRRDRGQQQSQQEASRAEACLGRVLINRRSQQFYALTAVITLRHRIFMPTLRSPKNA